MTNPTTVYTLISTDDKNDPRVEEFDMLSALKIRMHGIQANDPQYKLLANGRLVAWDWSEPELNISGIEIGGTPAPAKKTRATRSDKGATRKKVIDSIVAVAAETFNGGASS